MMIVRNHQPRTSRRDAPLSTIGRSTTAAVEPMEFTSNSSATFPTPPAFNNAPQRR